MIGRPPAPETVALKTLCRGVVWVVESHGSECVTRVGGCPMQHQMLEAARNLGIEVKTWHSRDGRLMVAKPPETHQSGKSAPMRASLDMGGSRV